MKVKPANKPGRVLIELGPGESKLVAGAGAGFDAFKLKSILVPIDFSECSKKALQYAIAFAKPFRASLILLYVAEFGYGAGEVGAINFERYNKEMIEEGRKKLAALAKRSPKSVPTKGIVEIGSPYNEIVGLAQKADVDLVIMSTHGRSGLKRFFIGSTTEKVVRHASCPVLVVREREHEFVDLSQEKSLKRKLRE